MKIVWTEKARWDLHLIVGWIALDKPNIAQKWMKKLRQKVNQIAQFPLRGRVVPERDDQKIREILFGDYRVIYWIQKKIVILTVINGAKIFHFHP